MSDSDSESKKKKRKKRKKKVGRAPRHLVVLKNADKGCHEHYKKGDSPIRFPHPFRLACLGKCNSGKSMVVKNILIAHQGKNPKFQEVIVVHGDSETKEYDDCDVTCIRTTIPEVDELDPDVKKLIIIDDYEFTGDKEAKRKVSELMRFGSTHRNTSIIVSHQSFFDVPKIVRDSSNVFIIWKPHDLDTLSTLGRRVGLKKHEIFGIFREHMPHWRDSLLINLIEGAPYKYGKNLFTPLEVAQDSDSESD